MNNTRNLAITYMCLYALLQSCSWAIVRSLSDDLSTATLFFFRNMIGVITILPLLPKMGLSLFATQHFSTHLLRAFAALAGGLTLFYAIAHLPLATVVAITFTAPIYASIGASFLYHERITSTRITALSAGLLGVLIVLRPTTFGSIDGLIAANAGALLTAMAFLLVKKLSNSESAQTMVAYPYVLILPFSLALAAFEWTMPEIKHLPLLLLLGVGIAAAQYFMAKAFSLAEANAVLPFDFTRLIVATALGAILFDDLIDIWTLVGAALILASAIWLAGKDTTSVKQQKTNN